MKQSAFATAVRKAVKKEVDSYERVRMQMAMDAACFAAHDVFGMGKGRALDFCKSFMKYINELCELIINDSKDDPKIDYAKSKIDRGLLEIVGEENFVPFDGRYGGKR